MAQSFKSWLKKQLAKLDEVERQELDLPDFEGFRSIIHEAERRAAVAGVPNAVAACRTLRPGGISIGIAREVLAECLAAIPTDEPEQNGQSLTVAAVAKRLGIGSKAVYRLCESGELPSHKLGKQIRIRSDDIDAFERQAVAAGKVKPGYDRHF